jgi:SAM-dependent methyltransferase
MVGDQITEDRGEKTEIRGQELTFMEANSPMETDAFFREYTSPDAILKYTRATAGAGISWLLDGDYKDVYFQALELLPADMKRGPLRMLEFGCGGGMNLLHLVSVLSRDGFNVASAIGTDFSPVLIQAANKEAQSYLTPWERSRVQFCVAKNEKLLEDLSEGLGQELSKLENSFQFVLGINTIRYCHRAGKQFDCARDIFRLLAPGGVCVVIDMNDRFPAFRSALRNKLRGKNEREEECYLPSLEEYTAPFQQAGFEVLRSEHFCWIPHSAGQFLTGLLRSLSPVLNVVARSRAMRSLVVARKPLQS